MSSMTGKSSGNRLSNTDMDQYQKMFKCTHSRRKRSQTSSRIPNTIHCRPRLRGRPSDFTITNGRPLLYRILLKLETVTLHLHRTISAKLNSIKSKKTHGYITPTITPPLLLVLLLPEPSAPRHNKISMRARAIIIFRSRLYSHPQAHETKAKRQKKSPCSHIDCPLSAPWAPGPLLSSGTACSSSCPIVSGQVVGRPPIGEPQRLP